MRLPWSLLGAPGVCYDIDGEWYHEPGSCEFCEKPMAKRYCGMCDEWVKGRECPKCGADTDAPLKAELPEKREQRRVG